MPKRSNGFILGANYHIFNRGTNKMQIYNTIKDYLRFESVINYYRYERQTSYSIWKEYSKKSREEKSPKGRVLVRIFAICLMPNHFHLQLQEDYPGGISRFMHRVSNSYAHYYNMKYGRTGSVFQNRFSSVGARSHNHAVYTSAYIHRNPIEAQIVKDESELIRYRFCSLGHYAGAFRKEYIADEYIMSFFEGREDYLQYVFRTRS